MILWALEQSTLEAGMLEGGMGGALGVLFLSFLPPPPPQAGSSSANS